MRLSTLILLTIAVFICWTCTYALVIFNSGDCLGIQRINFLYSLNFMPLWMIAICVAVGISAHLRRAGF